MLSLALVSAAYIAAQILADIASLRIVLLWGLSIDGGTFIYPLTFTLRDLVHKVAGARVARVLIISAAIINTLMALLFWFVSILPADPSVGPQTEFAVVLAPVWRIVGASILATRILASNALSVPLDSLIFCWGAFGGAMPPSVVWSIVLSNILIKGVVTLVSLPGIYLVKERA